MNVSVQLFARARDLAGSERVSVDVPDDATVGDVRAALVREYPALEPIASSLLVAVDADYATDSKRLEQGQVVACFPPVSGG
ncbi:molybdopterin synthase small subunit [Maioricimonas rarisocia]|uniref:Molybdopterin synthase sulfur carrier subunit n=1 Tax=Maioricimonas rarisocia TaxID=2528026 RepID=A0A517ZBK5_9PLAN|nr:molybdopterin converting factor subunit 1 [Maioricimonas rarisocia]QDU39873.1 molybdopterin synthase small subunit [Maioricimonas rarisocia]